MKFEEVLTGVPKIFKTLWGGVVDGIGQLYGSDLTVCQLVGEGGDDLDVIPTVLLVTILEFIVNTLMDGGVSPRGIELAIE
jgi:hypothetical protein